jgi:hypothetical protein
MLSITSGKEALATRERREVRGVSGDEHEGRHRHRGRREERVVQGHGGEHHGNHSERVIVGGDVRFACPRGAAGENVRIRTISRRGSVRAVANVRIRTISRRGSVSAQWRMYVHVQSPQRRGTTYARAAPRDSCGGKRWRIGGHDAGRSSTLPPGRFFSASVCASRTCASGSFAEMGTTSLPFATSSA